MDELRDELKGINYQLQNKRLSPSEEEALRERATDLANALYKVDKNEESPQLALPELVDLQRHGVYKYACVTCRLHSRSGDPVMFIRGDDSCDYHFVAAEQVMPLLESNPDCFDIEVIGGGRIDMNRDQKTCKVYGYSVQFGRAPHKLVVEELKKWSPMNNFNITYSDEGY